MAKNISDTTFRISINKLLTAKIIDSAIFLRCRGDLPVPRTNSEIFPKRPLKSIVHTSSAPCEINAALTSFGVK